MKRTQLIILFTLIISSCYSDRRANVTFKDHEFKNAWNNHDTLMIDKWINSLTDTLDDHLFYSRLSVISSITGFCYGNADPTEDVYWEVGVNERTIRKRNISKIYQVYRKSCLFLKETTWEETLSLQENYWEDSLNVEQIMLDNLSHAIDSICLRVGE